MSATIDSTAESWFDAGVAAMSGGAPAAAVDLSEAIRCFSKGLFLAPDSASLLLHRGEAFLRMCDFRSALWNFRAAHRIAPNDAAITARLAQLHYILGRLSLDSGDSGEAVSSFTEALSLQPSNTDFWIFRIKAWIKGKCFGKALRELNRFITDSEEQQDAAAAQMQQQREQPRRAKQEESKQQDDLSDAEDHDDHHRRGPLDDSDAPLPSDLSSSCVAPALLTARGAASQLSLWRTVQSLILRAKLHVLLDRSDLALRDAGWAKSLSPHNSEVSSLLESLSQKSESLYGTATAHLLAGQPEQALEALTKAMELNPNAIKLYSMRATLLRNAKRFDESLADLKRALSIKLQLKEETRRQQAAVAAASAAASSSAISTAAASSSAATAAPACAALAGGQTFLSEVLLSPPAASLDADPSATAVVPAASVDAATADEKDAEQLSLERSLALTFNALGVQYHGSGAFGHAVSCLSKAIDLDPAQASFVSNRGDCFQSLGERAQALSDFHRCLQLQPSNVGARVKIAAIHAEQGRALFNAQRYEDALAEFSRALSSDAYASSHYLSRAKTLHVLRHYESAYRDAQKAVDLAPGDPAARAFLMQLRQALLRPEDQARAQPLPPIPQPDRVAFAREPVASGTMQARRAASASSSASSMSSASAQRNSRNITRLVFGGDASSPPPIVAIKHKHKTRV